jgi:hypothetical protein
MPIARPRLLLNHLETVDITMVAVAPVPIDNNRLYVRNSCHTASAWLVNNRLKPAQVPIIRRIILGPYLSSAQPQMKAKTQPNIKYAEYIDEVSARLKANSAAMDLKNTPKVTRNPYRRVPMTR